jgi:CHAT domain-containing protein/surfactin synthase thioesterase subunit
VRVGARRGAGDSVRLVARPGEDVVVLSISNGPTLVLHPEDARDLMRAQAAPGTRAAVDDADAVAVPAQLGWPGLEAGAAQAATRGWMGQVLLGAVDVIKGLVLDHGVDIVSALATRKLDGRVDAGVYALSPSELQPLKGSGRKREQVDAAADGGPMLVLVHGTFVDTVSTFGKLWTLHPDVVVRLFAHYGGRVLALDHPTVGASPIANALTLVQALPPGARLHLLTHSRGGMVAEVLARACSGTLQAEDLALFADVPAAPGAAARDYAQHRRDLQALVQQAQAKGLQVERVLRVACPARGTLLASKRLDAYLSVLRWGLELAGLPVVPELVDFLGEVAQRRTDPSELPGLEAMTPDSPVVRWLNRGGEPIAGQLRVLAGDIEGDSLVSWVKTLLADAFYWTDNDLVVQTRSMYGGAARAASGAIFVLDRGAKVSHFNYFANERSVAALASGLLDEQPADFRLIGPLSWAGQDASGTRAATAIARSRSADAAGAPAENRPAVVLLPGILGSNLALDGKRVWLGLRLVGGLKRLAWDPATASRVTPDGAIGMVYDDLIEHLAATHEVIEFAYDWRRPVEDEAQRLGRGVEAALARRDASGQPVRLLAHSMGGLVARTLQLECPQVWQRLMARDGARLLMLGTPNAGSWAPMQVLSGDDTFGNTLVAFGGLFDDAGTREVMAAMPGFLQLQAALTDPALALDRSATWQQLADDDLRRLRERSHWHHLGLQLGAYRWSAPPQAVLDRAVGLRRRLDAQAAALGTDAQKMLLVVGRDRFTPAGYRLGDEGLEYLDAADGDGRVPLASALLPGVRTWRHEVSHGKLPDDAGAFAAYVELLASGDTQRLPRLEPAAPATRAAGAPAAPALVANRPSRGRRSASPPSLPGELYARSGGPAGMPAAPLAGLALTVLNGNLKFVNEALLVGHYASALLTGSEYTVDRLIGGAMNESLRAGLYPSALGMQQVFANLRVDPQQPLSMPRPGAVVVVGLGEEGRLRTSDLIDAVRQGALAYAQRVTEQQGGGAAGFELAATLVGSGGVGIQVGTSAQAIAQGVAEANQRLRTNGWPVVTRLRLIELYQDRAIEAQRALSTLALSRPAEFNLAPVIHNGIGAQRRPADSAYRGTDYDFITAVQRLDTHRQPLIEYTLDTRRARAEVRGQSTQARLVDELVRAGADANNNDPQMGRSLFQLLVPVEIEPFMAGSSALVLQLDSDTARFPWEMLDREGSGGSGEHVPWAVRTRVLRKLRTQEFRAQPLGSGREDSVLVIGEPQCDRTRFAELPAARDEAQLVAKVLGTAALIEPNALQVINALLAKPLRIVHIAGHGEFREDGTGGVVLSSNSLLGPNEVRAMRTVPELVFINCCFIGRIDGSAGGGLGTDRARFAAGLAEQLIREGVRCVVAAGWAVEDGPAKRFATAFYERLLAGDRFIDAVGEARRAAWEMRKAGNTWAAYQCYGDPDWRYMPPPNGDDDPSRALPELWTPAGLALLLESEALEARHADDRSDRARRRRLQRLQALQARYRERWGGMGAVAEAFGLAFAEAGDLDAAVDWYAAAVRAGDGSASLRAAEQWANLLARRGAGRSDAAQGRGEIRAAIGHLQQLSALHPTVERESLLGSAWKRLAMVDDGQPGQDALRHMVEHYARAEALAREQGATNLFYPIMNAMAGELRLAALRGQLGVALDGARVGAARQSLQDAVSRAPDFWSVVGLVELQWMQAVADKRLAAARASVANAFEDLAQRVPSPHLWKSARDQARFVLLPYAAAAGGAEAAAAKAVLKQLDALAQ